MGIPIVHSSCQREPIPRNGRRCPRTPRTPRRVRFRDSAKAEAQSFQPRKTRNAWKSTESAEAIPRPSLLSAVSNWQAPAARAFQDEPVRVVRVVRGQILAVTEL